MAGPPWRAAAQSFGPVETATPSVPGTVGGNDATVESAGSDTQRGVELPAAAASQIRRELEGQPTPDDGTLMDDVRRVIRQRGSVLNRSEMLRSEPEIATPVDAGVGEADHAQRLPGVRFEIAELCLRTARKLDALKTGSDADRVLIDRLRNRAATLLEQP